MRLKAPPSLISSARPETFASRRLSSDGAAAHPWGGRCRPGDGEVVAVVAIRGAGARVAGASPTLLERLQAVIVVCVRRGLLIALGIAAIAAAPARAQGPVNSQTEIRWIDGQPVEIETHGDTFAPATTGAVAGRSAWLPGTWCGTQTSADVVGHETGRPADAKIKVVEAVPSDRAASAEVRNGIQASIAQMSAHIAAESGGRRSLRFDLGTACGERYVDIVTLRLPKTAAEYGAGACNAGPLFGDIRPLIPKAAGPRNAIIYAPTIRCGAIAGFAQAPGDSQPGPGNAANRGGYLAVTFYMEGRTALHEIGHNLGAVQLLAPHTDGGRHCWDVDDVLCYPYFDLAPQSPLRPCDAGAAPLPAFDCGKDDYFNPAPAPESYLASNWNTYNSVFMCEVAACAPAAAPPATPPEEEQAPAPAAEHQQQPEQQQEPPPAQEPDQDDPPPSSSTPSSSPAAGTPPARRPAARKPRAKAKPRCRTKKQRRTKACRKLARTKRRAARR